MALNPERRVRVFVIRGMYRDQLIQNETFTLVQDYQRGVIVIDGLNRLPIFAECTGARRIKVEPNDYKIIPS